MNIPLTATEALTMESRPKQPKYARNKNIVVIGGSGSGKTRFFVKPSVMQMNCSMVITDPKGTLLYAMPLSTHGVIETSGGKEKYLLNISQKKSFTRSVRQINCL